MGVFRSSLEVFYEKSFLKNIAKFTGKQRSLFFKKVASLRLNIMTKKNYGREQNNKAVFLSRVIVVLISGNIRRGIPRQGFP